MVSERFSDEVLMTGVTHPVVVARIDNAMNVAWICHTVNVARILNAMDVGDWGDSMVVESRRVSLIRAELSVGI